MKCKRVPRWVLIEAIEALSVVAGMVGAKSEKASQVRYCADLLQLRLDGDQKNWPRRRPWGDDTSGFSGVGRFPWERNT